MLKRWQFWTLTVLAVLQAALMAASMYGFTENRRAQAEIAQRAQFIQESVRLEQLSREIALALAQLGVRNQDPQVQAMLGSLGITVNLNNPPPAAPGATERPKK